MDKLQTCDECGAALPPQAPEGLCPRCLVGMGLSLTPDKGAVQPASQKAPATLFGAITEGPGSLIGRYKLLEQVGEGGFGVVYVAEQREPVKRRVALKIIKLGMDTRQVIARFEAERQALALMDHPHIAKVLDGGATETGRPYFVMELVRGIKITDYCDQNQLNTRQRLDLFIQVCQATQHAHQKGIIHRDIKPSNILVTLHDGKPVPKVIDFGIAKATQQELTEKTVYTEFQQFIGTPAYISPEQAELSGLDIDTRSDIYSLGVLLYELLTGKTPFDPKEMLKAGLDEMRRTIREQEPLRPSTRLNTLEGEELTTTAKRRGIEVPKLVNLIRGDLDWIVMKCLEKDRTRRYDTAAGLGIDIQRHLQNEPVLARPPSASYRLQKLFRRNKLVFTAGAAIVTALVLGAGLTTWQAVRATRAEKRAQAEAQRADAEARRARLAEAGAVEKSTVAEAQRLSAEQQAEAIRLLSYVDAMNVAQRYYKEANFAQALSILQSHKPGEGKVDLRGFEWRYLYRLCRGNYSYALPKHNQVLGAMEFSPDGGLLATYCWDGAVRLWDLNSRARKPLFQARNASGLGGFSIDGRQFTFGGPGGSVQRYEVHTGQTTNALGASGEILAFSAQANLAVTLSADNRIKVWDLATAQLRFSLPGIQRRYLEFGWTDAVAIAPDGAVLAVIEPDQGTKALTSDKGIRLWDLRTGQERGFLEDHRQIRCLKFSPGRSLLAVGDGQGTVNLWNLNGGEPKTYQAHEFPVTSLAFSPNKNILATGSSDETIKLWDLDTGVQLGIPLRGQIGAATALAFSPDGYRLACGSRNTPVKIWNLDPAESVDEVRGLHTKEYGNFAFSPDGKSMAGGCEGDSIVVWDVQTLRTNYVLQGLQYVVAFTKDSRHLLASTRKNAGYWCDLVSQTRRLLPGHSGDLREAICVDLSPNGHLAALGYENGKIELWDVETGKAFGSIQAHSDRIRTLEFAPDGNTLVSGGSDHAVRLWDVNRQTMLGETKDQHKGAVCAAVMSRDGERLASACAAGTIKLWNPTNLATALITIPSHKSAIRVLDFSEDAKTLASGGEDKTVKLWNVASLLSDSPFQREVASFNALSDKIRLVKFSPNANILAIITDNGVLTLIRAITLKEADEEADDLKP